MFQMKYKIEYPTTEDLVKMEKIAIDVFGVPDKNMVAPSPEWVIR